MLFEHGTVFLYLTVGVWVFAKSPNGRKKYRKRGGASHGVFLFYT